MDVLGARAGGASPRDWPLLLEKKVEDSVSGI